MTILFDVRTLMFMGAAASLICAVMLLLLRTLHRPSRPAVLWAMSAELAFAFAMLLISLRGIVPDALSYGIANGLGLMGGLMIYGTARSFAQRPAPLLPIMGASALLIGLQLALDPTPDSQRLRLVLTSLVQGGALLASIPLLWSRRRIDPPQPLRWAIGFSALFATAHAVRIPYTLAAGVVVSADGMVVENLLHVAMSALFALAPMAYAMVVIGLVNGRIALELRALATTDTLTGVGTRRSFIEAAQRLLASCHAKGSAAALLMLDLDRFKEINDCFGHACGDRVLARFGRLISEASPDGAAIGRYGGEEFCILVPACDLAGAHRLAEQLCDIVRATAFQLDDSERRVTVSIGIAGEADGQSLPELLLAADRRLYVAKARGRDQVVCNDGPAKPLPEIVRSAPSGSAVETPGSRPPRPPVESERIMIPV